MRADGDALARGGALRLAVRVRHVCARAQAMRAIDRARATGIGRGMKRARIARRRDGAMMGDDRTRWRHARRSRGEGDDGEEGDVHVERARVVDGDAARGEGREG